MKILNNEGGMASAWNDFWTDYQQELEKIADVPVEDRSSKEEANAEYLKAWAGFSRGVLGLNTVRFEAGTVILHLNIEGLNIVGAIPPFEIDLRKL